MRGVEVNYFLMSIETCHARKLLFKGEIMAGQGNLGLQEDPSKWRLWEKVRTLRSFL
jgi:hypothetical protein